MTIDELRKTFKSWEPPVGPLDATPEMINAQMDEKLRQWGAQAAPLLAEALRSFAAEGSIDESALYLFYSLYARAHPAELAKALLAGPLTSDLVVSVLGDTGSPEAVAKLAPLVDGPFDEALLIAAAAALGEIATDDAVAALDRLEGRSDLSQAVRDEIVIARKILAYQRR